MPKKFGDNTKAVEVRARKNALKAEQDQKKQQEIEDAKWVEDDKHVLKKQERKENKEQKKLEQLEKKKEAQRLLDEEVAVMAGTSGKGAKVKITRAEMEGNREKQVTANKAPTKPKVIQDELIEENVNRLTIEGEVAGTVEEAINLFKSSGSADPVDMHPEKRMKAAYLAYETSRLPTLKAENPGLRLTQLKQMIRKDWNKAPENPVIQILMSSRPQ